MARRGVAQFGALTDEPFNPSADQPVPPLAGDAPTTGGGGGGCDCTNYVYEIGHPCYEKCKKIQQPGVGGADPAAQPCPGGESREASSGLCLCPGSQCRDINTKQCREPKRGEKQNWTDDIERPTGGGRGYCRPMDPGWENAGAGGGGGGAARTVQPSQYGDVWSQIQGLLNSPSRYTPEVIGNLTGQAKMREAGQNAGSLASINADTARRGIFRSPVAAGLVQKARIPAAEGFNKAVSDIHLAKVNADAQDKMFAVQAAMQWVQMMMQGNQFDANLKLAYTRLQQEWQTLQAQLNDPLRLLGPLF